jgi:hypothetical protein
MNLFGKSCHQGFEIIDLFLQRRQAGALLGGLFALLRFRAAVAVISLLAAARGADDFLPVILQIAVKRTHRAVAHDPQTVDRGLDQMPVMADQDDRAGEVVERPDQRRAAVDVEVVGRLVENDQVRRVETWPAPSAAAPSPRPRDPWPACSSFPPSVPSAPPGRAPGLPARPASDARTCATADSLGLRSSIWCWAKKPVLSCGASGSACRPRPQAVRR